MLFLFRLVLMCNSGDVVDRGPGMFRLHCACEIDYKIGYCQYIPSYIARCFNPPIKSNSFKF